MSTQNYRLILASQSPQRQRLLLEAGYRFETIAPDDSAESGSLHGETANELVARLARQKAANVAPRVDAGIVLACDTVAECGGRILGKPCDIEHAREMLQWLRGRLHHVYSGLCLWERPRDAVSIQVDVTKLRMEDISNEELETYLVSGAWQGKAGAFGYQDRPGWLSILAGSASNVIGLPMERLREMLEPH